MINYFFIIDVVVIFVENYEKNFNKIKKIFRTFKQLKKQISIKFHKFINKWIYQTINKLFFYKKWNHYINLKSKIVFFVKKIYILFKLIVESSFKFECVDLIRFANRKFRFEFEFESNSNFWHVRKFKLELNFKSKCQDLIWIWIKFQVSMSNLIWFVKNFNFMTYYIISRYFWY